jgi:hypothetical protein
MGDGDKPAEDSGEGVLERSSKQDGLPEMLGVLIQESFVNQGTLDLRL